MEKAAQSHLTENDYMRNSLINSKQFLYVMTITQKKARRLINSKNNRSSNQYSGNSSVSLSLFTCLSLPSLSQLSFSFHSLSSKLSFLNSDNVHSFNRLSPSPIRLWATCSLHAEKICTGVLWCVVVAVALAVAVVCCVLCVVFSM